jgi:hypothetical protein
MSSGSSSEPSLDNLDIKEIYEKIYEINDSNQIEAYKKEQENKFLE